MRRYWRREDRAMQAFKLHSANCHDAVASRAESCFQELCAAGQSGGPSLGALNLRVAESTLPVDKLRPLTVICSDESLGH
jgi:hypothetical protein